MYIDQNEGADDSVFNKDTDYISDTSSFENSGLDHLQLERKTCEIFLTFFFFFFFISLHLFILSDYLY